MPLDIAAALSGRLRPPLAIVLGSPREAADLAALAGGEETACYQMDLYQADRLRENLAERKLEALVLTGSDLWSLPANFQTVVYQAPERGERQLKLDMIEQAFHLLRPHGSIIVLSPYEIDAFFPTILKKIFGKFQAPAVGNGMMFLAQRDGDRPRRRHEVHFHGRFGDGPSFRFLSRPGVFSFGRFDNGARALVETMVVEPGNHVLDLGCGCGTNGICAARLAGPEGQITFVDSNWTGLPKMAAWAEKLGNQSTSA